MENRQRVFTGIWIPKDIYLNKEVKWIAKILFLEIHSFTANGDECFMSNEYISEFLGVSMRQVTRIIKMLKDVGWIEETSFDGRKRYLRSLMKISFDTGKAELTDTSNQHGQKCRGSIDKNVQHIKPIIKQDYSFKRKNDSETPKRFNVNPRKL